jgi:hypothetical protein
MVSLAARHRRQIAKAQASPPPLIVRSHHGGAGYREHYRSLSREQQFKIIMRLLKAAAKAYAKRYGYPEPIIQDEKDFVKLRGGGLTTPQLAEQYALELAEPTDESLAGLDAPPRSLAVCPAARCEPPPATSRREARWEAVLGCFGRPRAQAPASLRWRDAPALSLRLSGPRHSPTPRLRRRRISAALGGKLWYIAAVRRGR